MLTFWRVAVENGAPKQGHYTIDVKVHLVKEYSVMCGLWWHSFKWEKLFLEQYKPKHGKGGHLWFFICADVDRWARLDCLHHYQVPFYFHPSWCENPSSSPSAPLDQNAAYCNTGETSCLVWEPILIPISTSGPGCCLLQHNKSRQTECGAWVPAQSTIISPQIIPGNFLDEAEFSRIVA